MDIFVLLERHAKKSTQRYPLVTLGRDVDNVAHIVGYFEKTFIGLPE
jgi:hypothetical protein